MTHLRKTIVLSAIAAGFAVATPARAQQKPAPAPAPAAAAAPAVASAAAGPKALKMQSTWPASLTLQDNFKMFAERVDKLTNGQIKIEAMAAGQIVPAFEILDATHKKVIDGGHGVAYYWEI